MAKKLSHEEVLAHWGMLPEIIKKSKRVYTVLRSVAKSGMSRYIGFYVVDEDGTILQLNGLMYQLFGLRLNKYGNGVLIKGCGVDAGSYGVYLLSSVLFPNEEGGAYKIIHKWL